MKRCLQYIALTLCLLLSCVTHAQESEGASFLLREGSEGTLQVVFRLGDMSVEAAGHHYSSVFIEGMSAANGVAGHPALPSMSTLIQLPRGSRLTLGPVDGREELWVDAVDEGWPLCPVVAPQAKDASWPGYHPDAKVYASDEWYRGGEPLSLEHLGTMGGQEVYRLTVRPVAYNPVQRSLRVYTSLEAILTQSLIVPPSTGPERYLIVSRPQFREGLQPFVRWKRQQGYEVVERYADTNRREEVKELIDAEFADADRWPRYLLLVGDVAQLQSFVGTTRPTGMSQHITDLYYAEHTGDYLPDALLGRWPVNDTAELGAVVRKTLAYEQGRLADSAALSRLLLVAGAESQEPAPVTTNGQVDYLSREIKLSHPSLDTLCYYNPASANQRDAILNDLVQGVAALSYTAHCTTAGWSSPSVSFTSIDTLGIEQPLLYVNNCCLSNDFGGTCFGEQLLRAPVGGAIGVVGATNSTLWNEDYYWAVGPKYPFSLTPQYDSLRPGAFDRWLGRRSEVHSQGELLVSGNMAVTAFGSPYDKFYWEIYCLLGDPSLEPWVDVPAAIELYTTNGLPRNGAGSLNLEGTPGAMVTAIQRDTVVGRGTIGADGLLALELWRSLDTVPVVVTATLVGHRPHVDTLVVLPAEGMAVALRDVEITDSTVGCRVENVGTVPLYGLQVVLSQQAIDSAVDALVAEQLTAVDTLLPLESRSIVLPLQLIAAGQTSDWQAQLFAWDSTEGMLCSLLLQGHTAIAYPTVDFQLQEADGNVAHSLLSQHEYRLETMVEGQYDSLVLSVTALPGDITLSPFTVFLIPDTLTHLHLEARIALGNHRSNYDYYMVAGQRMDSFEEGMDSYPWQVGGTMGWQVDSTVAHGGHFSLRSGPIDYRQTSDLVLEVLLPIEDTLTYWSRISSEPNADKLLFSVDGQSRANDRWGEGAWKKQTVVLGAGRHVLRWRYVKDESISQGSDCAWIDDVRLPMALWEAPYGWFGDNNLAVGPEVGDPMPFKAFPNPSKGLLGWQGEGVERIRICDMYGRDVLLVARPLPSMLDLSALPDGLYLLQAATEFDTYNLKILIRH